VSDKYILDANGDPVPCDDLFVWARWLRDNERNRHVAHDKDEGPDGLEIRVSTVFLGLDHSFSLDDTHPPVLWETMVFGGLLDGEQQRYTSKAAALRGHQAMCERVTATIVRPL
jgi:hypothetical protein